MRDDDPFTPGFGVTPPVMVTSGHPVEDFRAALRVGRSTAGSNVLISGARGTGKTVLLTQMEEAAREAGWRVVALHTASKDIVAELRGEVAAHLRDIDPTATSTRVSSAQISDPGGFGAGGAREFQDRYDDEEPLGRLLDRALALIGQTGAGLLITVDEVQAVDRGQLHEVTQHLQDLIRRGRRPAFIAAGIRSGVEELLAEESTTFLRRAHRFETGSVDVGAAAEVIRETVAGTAKSIAPEAAAAAGELSQGYPYLIQVVGSMAWESSGDEPLIALEDVHAIRDAAIAQMVKNVHQPALRGISGRKLEYLVAMLDAEGPMPVSAIADAMGVVPKYQGVYRDRLIRDELIRPAGRGLVEFALPYLREAVADRRAGGARDATALTTTFIRTGPPRGR